MFQYFSSYDADIPKGLEVKNFTATHFTWLAITLAVMVLLVLIYRRLDKPARHRFECTVMTGIIVLEVIREGWLVVIGHYDLSRHLPLHLCGIMIFVETFAVFGGKPFLREFSYAVGMPGAMMALLMPEPSGYPLWNLQYLESIFVHALIALVPMLWIAGDGFRPNIRALPKNLALLAGLAAFCFGLNFLLGSNYMFVRFAPQDTIIALYDSWVGWPGYIVPLLGTVFVLWVLLYLPWTLAAMRTRKKQANQPASL